MTEFVPSHWQWVWFQYFGLRHPMVVNSTPLVRQNPAIAKCLVLKQFLRLEGCQWRGYRAAVFSSFPKYHEECDHTQHWVCWLPLFPHVLSSIPSTYRFITLQHDLFEITVDLAVGYTLDAALAHVPKFSVRPSGNLSELASFLISFLPLAAASRPMCPVQ